jgi:UrcA family protein
MIPPAIFRKIATTILMITVVTSIVSICEHDHVSYAAGTVRVDESGLDLSRRSGLFALYQRMQDAAMLACDPSGLTSVLPWYDRPDSGDCYVETLEAAIEGYANRALDQIHFELQLTPAFLE